MFIKKTEKHAYPVIKLFSKSKPLIEQISTILRGECITFYLKFDEIKHDKRGFTSTTHGIYISGKNNLHKFMSRIGFSNVKHLTKYYVWKNYGNLEPYTNLEERIIMLQSRSSSVVERSAHNHYEL